MSNVSVIRTSRRTVTKFKYTFKGFLLVFRSNIFFLRRIKIFESED